jgi:hypothetical protein
MAIKVNTTTVIDNSRVLQNIANTDSTTATTINAAIRSQSNALIIYDSTGAVVRTIYGAV